MKDKIEILDGEIFVDHRGRISSMNGLDFSEINRFYVISNKDIELVRGWHGHRTEKKWFYCLKGSFTMAFVKIDDWEAPCQDLVPDIVRITSRKSQTVLVPESYANCLRADEPDSLLLVFSSRTYPECLDDSYRYAPNYWFDWKEVK